MKKNNKKISSQNPSVKEKIIINTFSKEALLESLKKMNRNPEEIKIMCAMCYMPALFPKGIEYKCEKCGYINIHARDSIDGMFARWFPHIKRYLLTMPYKIILDPSGLCKKCSKGKELSILSLRVSCLNCEKEISVELNNEEDLKKIEWLYLKPPIKELNFGPQDKIYSPNEVAKYI